MEIKEVPIKDSIKLDQFLKWAGITGTGGQSKILINDKRVKVNGKVENKRGRKILPGDIIEVEQVGKFKVTG
ncbi:RNA-binding S4 domain-containing protein [Desulfofalx alkaliphila]|uniref:RNA-binding S4 domain-containing protein n=1 Tax=Desulfofalx alkaliphila TaxID=105483 RepID=UPI000B0F97AA|nr:RNA-binding S4 domain-containing protein [Desulfofalx alkaliphila]